MSYALVFFATLIADYFWAEYARAITDRRALVASLWSAGIVAIGAFTVLQYVSDAKMAIPAVLGAFCGTYLSVWRQK